MAGFSIDGKWLNMRDIGTRMRSVVTRFFGESTIVDDVNPRRRLTIIALIGIAVFVSGCSGGSSSKSTQDQVDRTAPVVAITGPTSSGSFTSYGDSIIVSGTASDNVDVSRITWSMNGSAAANVSGIASWSTPVILLNTGDNTITITVSDAAGNETNVQIMVTYIPGPSDVLNGIGILGDSNSDEYRADDNRGGAYAAVTFSWVELLAINRGMNFGVWGTRASPRRSGFEYNWALSGATTSSMLSSNQHTGVAQQVAAGNVTLVYVFIGHNDFAREKYAEIYDGTVSGVTLDNKITGVIDDITIAVDTVLAAGSVRVIVVELYEYSLDRPKLLAAFPNAARRQLVTDAIQRVNTGLAAMAQQRGAVLLDLTAYGDAVISTADANGFINVGGELIDTINPGNEPHHLNLDDGTNHGGTVGNGLLANGMFIEPVNAAFGTDLPPLSDEEILQSAGILP